MTFKKCSSNMAHRNKCNKVPMFQCIHVVRWKKAKVQWNRLMRVESVLMRQIGLSVASIKCFFLHHRQCASTEFDVEQ